MPPLKTQRPPPPPPPLPPLEDDVYPLVEKVPEDISSSRQTLTHDPGVESVSSTTITPLTPRSERGRQRSRSPRRYNFNRRSSFILPQLKIVHEKVAAPVQQRPQLSQPQKIPSPLTATHVIGSPPPIEESPTQKEFERKNLWQCCSSVTIDKRMITYLVQVCISCIVLLFCMFKLTHLDEGEDPTIWVSLLSGIVGNYLPSAQLK